MTYVLIVIWLAGQGVTATTQEFSSYDRCYEARDAIWDYMEKAKFTLPFAACTPK